MLAPAAEGGLDDHLEAAVRGEEDAREAVMRWCLPRVRRTLFFAYGPLPETDDLVQETLARVLRSLATFRIGSRFHVWVDRIAVNVARDHFKARGHRKLFEYDDRAMAHQPRGGHRRAQDTELDRQRAAIHLADHLADLKPDWRIPLVLRHLHGYTVPEIAAMLEISFEAAKKRLHRGRRELHLRLQDDPYLATVLRELGR